VLLSAADYNTGNYFLVPKFVDIEPGLLELFENAAGVRFCMRQCIQCRDMQSSINVCTQSSSVLHNVHTLPLKRFKDLIIKSYITNQTIKSFIVSLTITTIATYTVAAIKLDRKTQSNLTDAPKNKCQQTTVKEIRCKDNKKQS